MIKVENVGLNSFRACLYHFYDIGRANDIFNFNYSYNKHIFDKGCFGEIVVLTDIDIQKSKLAFFCGILPNENIVFFSDFTGYLFMFKVMVNNINEYKLMNLNTYISYTQISLEELLKHGSSRL